MSKDFLEDDKYIATFGTLVPASVQSVSSQVTHMVQDEVCLDYRYWMTAYETRSYSSLPTCRKTRHSSLRKCDGGHYASIASLDTLGADRAQRMVHFEGDASPTADIVGTCAKRFDPRDESYSLYGQSNVSSGLDSEALDLAWGD
ncbi:hypothetical protein EV363DRAFT_1296976 [Boletus edulis]|nr:hypothetical protein EV363DRAFT_1296976 [Boletus edulis]